MPRSAPLVVLTAIVLALAGPVRAQDPARYFDENCAPCHTIGGGEQGGPDLKWVTQRHDRQWLIRFVIDPEAMVASGDPRAVDMVKHWDGTVMPATADLTPQLADALLAFVEKKSNGAAAAQQPPPAAPVFTPDDVRRGREMFTGARPPVHGAPACIACHAVAGEGGPAGGGRLGADLTQVSARMRGPAGVARWLESPPTPMMRALVRRAPFTPDENRALTAFFADVGGRPVPSVRTQAARFTSAGVTAAVAVLAVIGFAWRGRLRGVRKPLVDRSLALRRGGDS